MAATITGGLVAMIELSGCVPLGGCGGADPEYTATYQLTASSSQFRARAVAGLAGDGDGLWILETGADGAAEVRHADFFDGPETLRFVIPHAGNTAGIAWDGTSLWIGFPDAHAWQVDPATGEVLRDVSIPAGATDLAWDGARLRVVEALGEIDAVDPATGALTESIAVRQQDSVVAVTAHDGETWVASLANPVLVYDTTGTLVATAQADAMSSAGFAPHLAFVGEDLVVGNASGLHRYAIGRVAQ